MNALDKLRLYLLAAAAAVLRIPLTYTVKFLPLTRRRTDFRGRAVSSHDTVRGAMAAFAALSTPANRKEKTDGLYYLEIEGREGIVHHAVAPVADGQLGGLHEGLPGAAEEGPAAAPPAQAAAAEAEGAAGAGGVGEHAAGTEAAAESGRSVGEGVRPGIFAEALLGRRGLGAPDEQAMQQATAEASVSAESDRPTLDDLGVR